MKRSPLKPGKPTRRNTPLRRTGWLSGRARETAITPGSGAPARKPQRRAGLRPRSARAARKYVTRRALVAGMLAGHAACEIRWDTGCQGRAADVHEPGMRCRGADICDRAQCKATCRWCHDQVHAHPAEATRRGWLIPSGRPSKAVPRRVTARRAA